MIGEQLGNWIIDRQLGRGGMGDVYLAHAAAGDGQAAVKVLAAELAREAGFRERFQREIEVLGRLSHPCIVRFYDSGNERGVHYYAMEYVDGPSYEDLLHEAGRLPWQEVLDLALQICPALKHAHDHGIIHRDLKPSNLLRSPAGEVKLTDFGIARVFSANHLTATGGIVGTAEFLSPEQAMGKPAGKRSDLYSLGVVLYALLVGRPPFLGDTLVDLLHKHRFAQFDRPRKLVPEVPHELDEIVCQLLEKEPDRRPADAMVLQRQLESMRRKLARKDLPTLAFDPVGSTQADAAVNQPRSPGREGPATLMSRLMRHELEQQKHGGPLRRFVNKPVVLGLLLVLCVGLIVWALWPASAQKLFQRGEALMASKDPDDWDRAVDDYLDPLDRRYPDHPYHEAVAEFHRRIERHRAQRQAARNAPPLESMSEAQWFYQEGLRLRQQGRRADAERLWLNLVRAFRDVPAEQGWVELAQRELTEPTTLLPAGERRWPAVRESLRRAQRLEEQGKKGEAEEIRQGLEELYRDDPSARDILEALRRERGP